MGRHLGSYLSDVDVFDSKVAPIAGYLDGHVSRFNSRDAYRVGANAHDAMITKVFR